MTPRTPLHAFLLLGGLVLATACSTTRADLTRRPAVDRLLDDWHRAASEADGERYFAAFADGAVFLGTDASERWTLPEFRAYAEPHFSKGSGWTYAPFDRHVLFSPDGRSAWFDERLRNEKYGELRGTGALVRQGGEWKIAHYNMSFPIPNELTQEIVARIRAAR